MIWKGEGEREREREKGKGGRGGEGGGGGWVTTVENRPSEIMNIVCDTSIDL